MIESGGVVVLSTFTSEDDAASVGRTLVEEALAACAQVSTSAVRSLYAWEGSVQDDREFVLWLKSTEEGLEALCGRLHELHPYDVPQIVVLPARASSSYLAWVRACVSGGRPPEA